MSQAYGGEAYALNSTGSMPAPPGLRRLSASLMVGAAAGAALVVLAGLAHGRLVQSPLYADPRDLYYDEIDGMLTSLTFQVVVGIMAAVLLGLCAVLVVRPRPAARTAVLSISFVMIAVMMVVSSIDAGVGGSDVAQAQLPAWYPAVQFAEVLIVAALVPVVMYIRRRRFRDFYEYG